MKNESSYKIVNGALATIWLVNGLFCKVLNFAPRHEQIVARILGNDFAYPLTICIGLAEVVMAVWIVSRFAPKLNAIAQMAIVAIMNILEFMLVPDLLLWGRLNSVFAAGFILLVFYNEFVVNKKTAEPKSYV